MTTGARPRRIHAGAWWVWAIGLGFCATRTTNPVLLVLIVAVTGWVSVTCRPAAPWAGSYGTFLRLALVVIVIRVLFHAFVGGVQGPTELFSLPEVPLPDWADGIRLGGAVTTEGLVASVYDGLRLGTLLVCVGAANSLADPRRLLASLPGALYEVSVAVVVALTTAPQLVVSAKRIRRARQLRGSSAKGVRRFTSLLVPVVEDALERSLALAATMDSRGYGRPGDVSHRERRLTGICTVGGLAALAFGTYGWLDTTAPDAVGVPVLLLGLVLGVVGLTLGSRRVPRTRYRPDRWGGLESLVALGGVAAVVGVLVTEHTGVGQLFPDFTPLAVPELPLPAALGVLVGLLPVAAVANDRPARAAASTREVTA